MEPTPLTRFWISWGKSAAGLWDMQSCFVVQSWLWKCSIFFLQEKSSWQRQYKTNKTREWQTCCCRFFRIRSACHDCAAQSGCDCTNSLSFSTISFSLCRASQQGKKSLRKIWKAMAWKRILYVACFDSLSCREMGSFPNCEPAGWKKERKGKLPSSHRDKQLWRLCTSNLFFPLHRQATLKNVYEYWSHVVDKSVMNTICLF